MAQYWKDFTSDTVGQAPSGMTSRFNAPQTLQVQTDATATLGASLRIIRTSNARTFLSLDAVTDSGRTTIKGRIKYKKTGSSGLTHIGFGMNGAGGVGSETCYAGVTSAGVARRIAKYASGTFSVILDASSFSGTGTGVWRHLDFEATPKTGGYDFKIKTYAYDANPELATWSVTEDVSSPITTAGWVGLFCNEAMTYDIEYIAIGTGGDLPPTGQVTPPVNLVADFDFTPASGASPLEVTFTDSSTGSPTSWAWDFGDGATSTSQNPTHTYEFSGTYDVSLTVSDGTNNDTETVLNAVSVNPAVGAPVIVEPTERGCVDAGWSVGYSTPDSAYKIIFAPRRQENQSVVWFFQLNNVVGTRPIFELDADDGYLIVPGGWRPVWTTTPSDYNSWTPFSSVSDQTTFIRFQHATNFLADTVYVAFRPVVLPSWVDSKMAALASNPAVLETPSSATYGGNKHQIGTTPQCANEVGKTIPPMPLWAFRLGTGPLKAVFVADQHPGEDYGGISFWEAVDYLLAGGTIATALLEQYSIYCYPMVNPVGRYGGHYRYTYESGTEPNPNRDWKTSGGFTTYSVDRVHDAIVEDTGDDVPVIGLDFHGHGLTNATYRFVNAATTAYRAAINARFPYADWQDVTTTTEYTFRDFYTNRGAYFAVAIETGYGRNDQMEYSTAVGVAAMEALYDIADDVWAAYPQPVQKIFEAACNASLQSSDILASILRQVQAQCDSSLTSQDVILAVLRQFVASCAGSLISSDITVSTVAEKLFQAACAASLTSSDSALNIARTLSCNCNGVVSSSDVTLTLAGLLTFLAECAASTTGSDVTASISRVLSADSTVSLSSSDISVFNLITLAATCNPTVSATDVALSLRMYLQAVCDGTLSASDASVSVAALLSAACGAVVSSRDILVLFTDEIILPELFDAFSRITTSLDGLSRVTATLDGYSRVDRSAN